jgi:hypothetical protein
MARRVDHEGTDGRRGRDRRHAIGGRRVRVGCPERARLRLRRHPERDLGELGDAKRGVAQLSVRIGAVAPRRRRRSLAGHRDAPAGRERTAPWPRRVLALRLAALPDRARAAPHALPPLDRGRARGGVARGLACARARGVWAACRRVSGEAAEMGQDAHRPRPGSLTTAGRPHRCVRAQRHVHRANEPRLCRDSRMDELPGVPGLSVPRLAPQVQPDHEAKSGVREPPPRTPGRTPDVGASISTPT